MYFHGITLAALFATSLPALSPDDPVVQVALFVVGLVVVWVVLRFILRLAMRLFAAGCLVILALGLILVLIRYFS